MKKPEAPASRGGDKRRKQLQVVFSDGSRQRFLRGMITHDLVQRGLEFEQAYATASAVRDQLAGRDEVTSTEVRDLVMGHVERALGGELPPGLTAKVKPVPQRQVLYHGQKQPFSRGLLARSILAAGIDIDRAYTLIAELEKVLSAEEVMSLTSGELARRVADLLERSEGAEPARRYRLMRRIHRLPRPLVIYVGGASGTGKSTHSVDLAPLFKIYRINATDLVRQVMRMVFSPEMMPAIYTSSFEVAPPPGVLITEDPYGEGDPTDRLIRSFEDQASRVLVGVRAIVERAISENISILVEGIHLYPPLVPFPDLEGAAYQVPLLLTTHDVEVHRSRFMIRGRLARRRAERYLENFHAIRTIHDFLLQQAETHDVPLVDTSHPEPPVAMRAMRLVTSILEQRLPGLAQPDWKESEGIVPGLLLIVDGLPDRPVRALGGRTPLMAAVTPTLDRLAREGRCGLTDPVAPGVVPDTAAGTLALFGQSPLAMKRGPVEALGAGLELRPGDVALRGNLATLDARGQVVDRRAGRIRDQAAELADALDHLALPEGLGQDVVVRVQAATEHRLAVVLRGEGLSSAIQGSDPGDGAAPGPPLTPRPDDPNDERATYTANVVALFEQAARKVLCKHRINKHRCEAGLPPANAVLTRGAGTVHRLVPLEESGLPLRVACVGADRTVLGVAEWLGADVVSSKEMTANLDTDLEAKLEAARKALRSHDLVIVHVKGADIAAHDQRPDLKVEFLERLDVALDQFLKRHGEPFRIAVASDHATLSESGQHAADPLPTLIWGDGVEADEVTEFNETSTAAGSLQRFPLQLLLGRLFDLS